MIKSIKFICAVKKNWIVYINNMDISETAFRSEYNGSLYVHTKNNKNRFFFLPLYLIVQITLHYYMIQQTHTQLR